VTFISFVCGIICGYFATQRDWTNALIFWGLNRFFDGLDGSVARVSGQQSDFGGYFGPSIILRIRFKFFHRSKHFNIRYRDGFYDL
jgi:hypothetical protein